MKRGTKVLETPEQIDGYWLDCDFIGGACYAYENGVKHIATSKTLAETKSYGFAVSHLVLGAEELIKGLILIFLNTDRHFIDHKKKEKLFANHYFKHSNIKDFLMALTKGSFDDYDLHFFDYYFDGNHENNFQQKAYYMNKVLKLGEIDEKDVGILITLLNDANQLKNRGFYVDYGDDWEIPDDIAHETFAKYLDITNKLMMFAEPIFTRSLEDDENLVRFIYGE
ncbi:AbiV family abortive infection protein [Mucilaginibacter sp. McL0603]|uniref:AbiV family abortive infection protein n=1 Tax=Mucilaginibacter sp. McL0603 TaxID=3415670 RepID=UPI003CF27005